MTVVAWDGKTLAADKRTLNCGLIRTVTKIRRIGELLVGGSSDFVTVLEMMDWIEKGSDPEKFPSLQKDKDDWACVIIIDRGVIKLYERSHIPMTFEDSKFAIGSGRDFALAAMHCGKTAKEAVEIAIHFDSGCGNGVDCLELE